MTQQDKELLLKDLCARLPYGVKAVITRTNCHDSVNKVSEKDIYSFRTGKPLEEDHGQHDYYKVIVTDIKPYLFPMSSMTEEQQEEFDRIYADDMQVVADNLKNRLDGQPYEMNLGHYRHIDWLNKNHFDYRGLIPKGIAKDATGLNIY